MCCEQLSSIQTQTRCLICRASVPNVSQHSKVVTRLKTDKNGLAAVTKQTRYYLIGLIMLHFYWLDFYCCMKGKTKTRSKLQNPCKLLHQYFNPIKKTVVYYSYISLQNSHFFTWPYLLLFNFLFRFVIFASLTKISMRHYNLFPVFSSITYCLLFR